MVDIQGGLDAKLMRDWLRDGKAGDGDRDPYAVSHLGWGMNPQALWYGIALNGDVPEVSRAAARTFPGNFLFSTGPNSQGGGKRTTRGHYDVPMRDCTIELDGEPSSSAVASSTRRCAVAAGARADARVLLRATTRGTWAC